MSNPILTDIRKNTREQFYELPNPFTTKAVIKSVDDNSPAADAGLEPGDIIVEVDGQPLIDILAWMWLTDSDEIELGVVAKQDAEAEKPQMQQLILDRSYGEEWGIEFELLVFDGIRRCKNSCTFCFMTQLPKGMRPALSIRDDDYRLSFLQGNFVTLTNLSDEDIARIVEQRISPLNVSFHAYDSKVRTLLIGRNHARGIEAFEQLAQAGIEMNIQIVLVPEINDGEVLEQTLDYLHTYRQQVKTVGIVPVAYTKETAEIAGKAPKSFSTQLEAASVISQVQLHQFKERADTGETWVHLADEFYIVAEAPFPQVDWYDGYPQYENGIGITLSFIEDVRTHLKFLNQAIKRIRLGTDGVTLITGTLPANSLVGVLEALEAGTRVRLLPIPNRYFGGNVSVTGLLTGQDILDALAYDQDHIAQPTTYLLPTIIFNADGLTLDGYTKEELLEKSKASLVFIDEGAKNLAFGLRDANELTKAKR